MKYQVIDRSHGEVYGTFETRNKALSFVLDECNGWKHAEAFYCSTKEGRFNQQDCEDFAYALEHQEYITECSDVQIVTLAGWDMAAQS